MTVSKGKERIFQLIKEKGILWTTSYVTKYIIRNKFLDNRLLKKLDNGEELIDLPSHSVDANKQMWNDYYDWSESGNEWTSNVTKYKGVNSETWKNNLIDKTFVQYFKKNSSILEIGPGAGRWTDILQEYAIKLILADISLKCLDMCKKRFSDNKNIEYNLIKKDLNFLADSSVDFIWSYDVFVHINPSTINEYVTDIKRILKPNGIAIIHHSGRYNDYKDPKEGWRSFYGKDEFAKLILDNKLEILEQNNELPHLPGDIISIFCKSSE